MARETSRRAASRFASASHLPWVLARMPVTLVRRSGRWPSRGSRMQPAAGAALVTLMAARLCGIVRKC